MNKLLDKMKRSQLQFSKEVYQNIFSKLTIKNTLQYQISKPRYKKFGNIVISNYKDFLDEPLGIFLLKLKLSEDMFYKYFLNDYGDLAYTKFILQNSDFLKKKGLYTYVIDDEICYIGRCTSSFNQRINMGYGNISPKNCYLDGQATNCHLNNLLLSARNRVELWIEFQSENELIIQKEKEYIKAYNPKWNIQLTTAST